MKTNLRRFDGYIGIEIEVDSEHYRQASAFDHGILFTTVRWCRVSKKKGQTKAHWDELEKVWNGPQSFRFLKIPRDFEVSHTAMVHYVQNDILDGMLDLVEENFCKIGECKINPKRCPERKEVS